jgi:hypothetical protein
VIRAIHDPKRASMMTETDAFGGQACAASAARRGAGKLPAAKSA